MGLVDEYRRQSAWRPWREILRALPACEGRTILDLGCGPGDQAAELVARGARVIGFDANQELLEAARARGLAGAEFHRADLRTLPELAGSAGGADGIWCSFAAAYFVDLPAVLAAWRRHLRPGGWIALTEVDDLFGHEPLDARAAALLAGYAREALDDGRYDFRMGGKLAAHLQSAGFELLAERTVEDPELSFRGPARPEVLEAWRARLDRMPLLHRHCGPELGHVREQLLACLGRADHRSACRVVVCLATAGGA